MFIYTLMKKNWWRVPRIHCWFTENMPFYGHYFHGLNPWYLLENKHPRRVIINNCIKAAKEIRLNKKLGNYKKK